MANKTSPLLMIIDDDAEIRYSLTRVLTSHNYEVICAGSGEEGIEVATKEQPSVIFLDNRMGGMSGIEALQHLRTASPQTMIIVMTAYGTAQTAIEAMKYGAFDYIIKPFDLKKVLNLTTSALKAHDDLNLEASPTSRLINIDDYKEGIVGNSEKMHEVFKVIGQVTASDATVMINGESGTGKELVARCIYQHSQRSNQPFIAVNCAAIPDNLIESELFGHEKGSFTGATSLRKGKFELCDKGSIFLDEIGDMALQTQTKILRAIQEGEIQRVGGEKTIKVNIRLIAATHKNLKQMVKDKTFREDLYYRLNVITINIPPLRERLEDIPELIDYMIQRLNSVRNLPVKEISTEAMSALSEYTWPGNVRELENVMHRSAVLAQSDRILLKDLPEEIRPKKQVTGKKTSSAKKPQEKQIVEKALPVSTTELSSISAEEAFNLAYKHVKEISPEGGIVQIIEREFIQRALNETKGNMAKAATILGITRSTLRKRVNEFNIKF